MDNITHSLTGVLAARVFPRGEAARHVSAGNPPALKTHRTLFWLMLVSVNLPDIDVIANFFTDPLHALHYHRGFTHSFMMVPLVALLPAVVARLFDRRARFAWLWTAAMTGVALHIFIDLITPYGTQVFFPVTRARYSLDWMFIIDPWFTGALTLLLVAGKIAAKHRRVLSMATLAFACAYIGAEVWLHGRALGIYTDRLSAAGTRASHVSVLPQPLSLMEWVGLAMTPEGPVRQYIRLSGGGAEADIETFPLPGDRYVRMARETPYVATYLEFARFPVVSSLDEGGLHRVEFRDLQFSVDPRIARAVGLGERDIPFVLRLEFGPSDSLQSVTFNGRPVPRVEGLSGKS